MTSTDWLALCLITESNRADEWRFIAWCIRNRVDSGRYPGSVRDVVLQRRQFSHFNDFEDQVREMRLGHLSEHALFQRIKEGQADGGRRVRGLSSELLGVARMAASEFLSEGVWRRPFAKSVLHYYSPISMVPVGSEPAWASSASRLFTPSCVDPERFVFAENVG